MKFPSPATAAANGAAQAPAPLDAPRHGFVFPTDPALTPTMLREEWPQ